MLAAFASGCATVAPTAPRFVVVFQQQTGFCRIDVFRDTRSQACFMSLECGRHGAQFVVVPVEVCIP